MKFPRLLVFVGGILGVLAFFMPLIRSEQTLVGKPIRVDVSGYHMTKGISSLRDVAKGDFELDPAEDERLVADMNQKLDETRVIYMVAFAPGILLVLLAVLGRLGRGKAIFALIIGLLGVGIWALLDLGFSKVLAERKADQVPFEAGIALLLLLASSGLGSLGGLFGTIRPDRGAPASPTD